MRIKDVPQSPAYLVWHDAHGNGEMDVYGSDNFEKAKLSAKERNEMLAMTGMDDCGFWRAYEKLPRVRVYAYMGMVKEKEIVKGG